MHAKAPRRRLLAHTIDFPLVEKLAQEHRELTAKATRAQILIEALTADQLIDVGMLNKLDDQILALVLGTSQVEPPANGTCDGTFLPDLKFPLGFQSRLAFDPTVHDVYPVVVGTRITTHHIVKMVVDGMSWATILSYYPELSEDGIRASLEYSCAQEA